MKAKHTARVFTFEIKEEGKKPRTETVTVESISGGRDLKDLTDSYAHEAGIIRFGKGSTLKSVKDHVTEIEVTIPKKKAVKKEKPHL